MCCAAHLEIALFQRYLAHVPLARDHFQQRLASGGADWIAVHCKLPQLGGLLVSMLTLHFDSLRFASLHIPSLTSLFCFSESATHILPRSLILL